MIENRINFTVCILVEGEIENKDKWESVLNYTVKLRHSQLTYTNHSPLHTSMFSGVILFYQLFSKNYMK